MAPACVLLPQRVFLNMGNTSCTHTEGTIYKIKHTEKFIYDFIYLIYISLLLRKKSLGFRSLVWLTLRCALALVEPRLLPGSGLARPRGRGKGTICGLRDGVSLLPSRRARGVLPVADGSPQAAQGLRWADAQR